MSRAALCQRGPSKRPSVKREPLLDSDLHPLTSLSPRTETAFQFLPPPTPHSHPFSLLARRRSSQARLPLTAHIPTPPPPPPAPHLAPALHFAHMQCKMKQRSAIQNVTLLLCWFCISRYTRRRSHLSTGCPHPPRTPRSLRKRCPSVRFSNVSFAIELSRPGQAS